MSLFRKRADAAPSAVSAAQTFADPDLAEDALPPSRERVDVRPAIAGPSRFRPPGNSEDDRAFLTLLYTEHASLARQQDWLRNFWAAVVLVLTLVLLVVGTDPSQKRIAGALLCGVGVLGGFTLNKLRERYNLHLRAMRAYRTELGHSVRPELSGISLSTRLQHNKSYRLSRLIGTQLLWALVCLAAVAAGARFVWQATTNPYIPPPLVYAPGRAAPAAAPGGAGQIPIQVPIGSELP